MPFVNTAKTKIHNFWLTIPLGGPKMAAALPTKRLYPPIAALCDFDIVLRRTGHLNVSNGSWQHRSKWRARKDLAILAVACNDPVGVYDSLKRDGTAVTPTCYFHEASFQNKFLSALRSARLRADQSAYSLKGPPAERRLMKTDRSFAYKNSPQNAR